MGEWDANIDRDKATAKAFKQMGPEKPPEVVKVADEVPLTQLLALKSLMGFGDRGYFYLNRFLGLNFGKKIPSHPIIRRDGRNPCLPILRPLKHGWAVDVADLMKLHLLRLPNDVKMKRENSDTYYHAKIKLDDAVLDLFAR